MQAVIYDNNPICPAESVVLHYYINQLHFYQLLCSPRETGPASKLLTVIRYKIIVLSVNQQIKSTLCSHRLGSYYFLSETNYKLIVTC